MKINKNQVLPSQESGQQTQRVQTEHIDRLWIRMTELYGYPWINQFGESDSGTWFNALKDLTVDELKRGLASCFDRDEKKFPPGLVEFRSLCRPKIHPCHKDIPRLTGPKTDKKTANEYIKKMKEIINDPEDKINK